MKSILTCLLSVLLYATVVFAQKPTDTKVRTRPAAVADAKERDARRAKNVRYNAGGTDLTKRHPKIERFVEQVWPSRELIPATESAVIATGRVVKIQPYLSADGSRRRWGLQDGFVRSTP